MVCVCVCGGGVLTINFGQWRRVPKPQTWPGGPGGVAGCLINWILFPWTPDWTPPQTTSLTKRACPPRIVEKKYTYTQETWSSGIQQ